MDQLIEGMLAVRARFAPDDRAAGHLQIGAIHAYALAVAFHFKLLKIGRQAVEKIIIRQHGTGRVATNLIVPDTHKGQHGRQVILPLSGLKMPVHRLCTAQKRAKSIRPNGDHQRQANRAPHRIATTDPIGEPEHVRGINTECCGLVRCR